MAMQLCSPSASSSSSSCPCSNPRFTLFKISRKPLRLPSSSGRATAVLMDRSVKSPARGVPLEKRSRNELEEKKPPPAPEGVLVVRRPEIESDRPEFVEKGEEIKKPSAAIDGKLEEFAKKMPIFEPDRLDENAGAGSAQAKPLSVNLDLALYRAKVLSRSFRYQEAEAILQQCISTWPEDGRAYVALGKILGKQSKTRDARAVYEKGCQATQGENPYVWQCWAVLENRMGNIRRARELFDAATVADKKHIAAWHGWAVLELKQGNVKKARQLLARALKFCGGNEYVYQTLALLEARANRSDQARYLFREATKCNPKSCASWLAWAQLEMQQENNLVARQLFEKAVQASPKNRFAWQVWGVFEATIGNIEKARKLLKIGHALNPKDSVLLQSLALIEYKHSTANLARVLFRKASQLDPRHQPVWIAWGWMEWKEGNVSTARELYQRALSISTTTESAARCLQAWGVLEQRAGNLSAARRLFRSSLNINSQSYVTWMTWAKLEEDQGNAVRAEEIRNLYFQQRTEVVDDSSWVTGFFDIIDPALDSIKKLLNLDQNFYKKEAETGAKDNNYNSMLDEQGSVKQDGMSWLDLDSFIKTRLSLDPAKLDLVLDSSPSQAVAAARLLKSPRSIWRPEQRSVALSEPGV
ncbi:unnamed protein product [Linum trigynum]|uniref:Protein high chlorophyll fluorescent 107 n=1 Tax=Linum trigynum TaxID=586398 RepID=A0AAV2FGL2_9ROSI